MTRYQRYFADHVHIHITINQGDQNIIILCTLYINIVFYIYIYMFECVCLTRSCLWTHHCLILTNCFFWNSTFHLQHFCLVWHWIRRINYLNSVFFCLKLGKNKRKTEVCHHDQKHPGATFSYLSRSLWILRSMFAHVWLLNTWLDEFSWKLHVIAQQKINWIALPFIYIYICNYIPFVRRNVIRPHPTPTPPQHPTPTTHPHPHPNKQPPPRHPHPPLYIYLIQFTIIFNPFCGWYKSKYPLRLKIGMEPFPWGSEGNTDSTNITFFVWF